MPFILLYLLKLSVSLAVVYIFYQLLLRRLTFYNWNRWYLLGYTFLSFLMPFVNITPALERNQWINSNVVNWVPVIHQQNTELIIAPVEKTSITSSQVIIVVLYAGMGIMLLRLLMQYLSFWKMRKKAEHIYGNEMKVYQVNDNIIPFSFGRSVFINRRLHTEQELQEIILHEFVHIRQRHSFDIIWSELLCLVNWFNPFAWLLKKSIRQNLEFIADSKVLDSGINKKEYQYLLLKVTGNNQYSIATPFNFSSLKKRIAMMNKLKSARVHLVKFMFMLPLAAVMLLAFRSIRTGQGQAIHFRKTAGLYGQEVMIAGMVVDGKTLKALDDASVSVVCKGKNISTVTDYRGYYSLKLPFEDEDLLFSVHISKAGYADFNQNEHWGNFNDPAIYGKYGKNIFLIGLNPSGELQYSFSVIAGNPQKEDELGYEYVFQKFSSMKNKIPYDKYNDEDDEVAVAEPPEAPVSAEGIKMPPDVIGVDVKNKIIMITLKNGGKEKYDFNNPAEKNKFIKKYGKLPVPPQPPAPQSENLPASVKSIDDNIEWIEVWVKDGKRDTFYFTDPAQKAAFEKKYRNIVFGQPLPPSAVSVISSVPVVAGVKVAPVSSSLSSPATVAGATVAPSSVSVVSPTDVAAVAGNVIIADKADNIMTGDEAIVITITKNTTRQQLDEFVKQMKAKGIELIYDEIEYDNKGKLIKIGCTMKSKNGQSNAVATEFDKLTILSLIYSDGRSYFKVTTEGGKVSI